MILDANIFLESLLAQEQAESCETILTGVQTGARTATLTGYHLGAITSIVEAAAGTEAVQTFLGSLIRYEGLTIRQQSVLEFLHATRLMNEYKLDLDDALVVQAADATDGSRICTLDGDFDRLTEYDVVSPQELLE